MDGVLKLSDVLVAPRTFAWNLAIYLPASEEWSLNSPALILDPDDAGESSDEPAEAAASGMRYVVGVSELQDIVANAQMQKRNCSLDELMEAFKYYVRNDAFITLT